MKYINIGKLVNTHGIKGEVRILSDFRYKDKVFKKDMIFYIGKNKDKYVVNSYRVHKNYDMVTFKNINNINDVINLKGSYVYINSDDLVLDNNKIYIDNLINYDVIFGNKNIGKVTDIMHNSKANDNLVVNNILLPYVDEFIIKIEDNKIYYKEIGGLINED